MAPVAIQTGDVATPEAASDDAAIAETVVPEAIEDVEVSPTPAGSGDQGVVGTYFRAIPDPNPSPGERGETGPPVSPHSPRSGARVALGALGMRGRPRRYDVPAKATAVDTVLRASIDSVGT